jgi:hypothetical protein
MVDLRFTVAQLGARMHYAVPRIFHEAGLRRQILRDGSGRADAIALRPFP